MPGRKTSPGKYRGLWVEVKRDAKTKKKQSVDKGILLLAVGDATSEGWVPVLLDGRLDHVRAADVERIVQSPKRPSSSTLAARKRLAKRAGVRVSIKRAEQLAAQWRR